MRVVAGADGGAARLPAGMPKAQVATVDDFAGEQEAVAGGWFCFHRFGFLIAICRAMKQVFTPNFSATIFHGIGSRPPL